MKSIDNLDLFLAKHCADNGILNRLFDYKFYMVFKKTNPSENESEFLKIMVRKIALAENRKFEINLMYGVNHVS